MSDSQTPKKTARPSVLATRLLMKPRITEKAYAANTENRYVFHVAPQATKSSIRRAVEEAYGVEVIAVNISKIPAKKRIFGRRRSVGYTSAVKKASVKLKAGQSIELFKAGI